MPFKKGQSGNPHGRPARPKLDDKYTFNVAQILIDQGCCPFTVLADLAMNSKSEHVRCEAASTLTKYVAPQLKSIEHKAEDPGFVRVLLTTLADKLNKPIVTKRKVKRRVKAKNTLTHSQP